jgi:hypothetical protein
LRSAARRIAALISAIERSIAEINEAIRRTAARRNG